VTSRRPLRVVVLIDALGWSYIEGKGFLVDWLPHQQPLRTVLGYSSGAIPSLLTGEPPSRHGHWNLFYYDPERSPFRWLPGPLGGVLDNRLGRRLLREMGRRLLGLGPLFEVNVAPRLLRFLNWAEKNNVYAPGGISGAPSLFDRLERDAIRTRVYTYHRFKDAEALERAPADIASGDEDFYFVYLSEIDHVLHHHCAEPDVVDERLRWYASRLSALFSAARRRDPAARFLLVSDHGMTPVKAHLPLAGGIDALGWHMPEDYLAVYDSTMARFWFFRDEARQAIEKHLRSVGHGRILADDELETLGIRFPDQRYGETIFLLDPGWLVTDSGFNGRGWTPAGMHGYHPDDPWSDGVFLASVPPVSEVRSLGDVYPELCKGLGGA
jgi:predicted AlkP superfamily pyrophosphatase or phosphodiesterase